MNATFRTFAAAAFGLFAATAVADTVLTKDEDWSGQEATLLTGTIDLNGHNLTISQFAGACTITDANTRGAVGELHVNVAKGVEIDNTSVTLAGFLKLVKEGEGNFTATKTYQTYSGGTEVAGGKLTLPTGIESNDKRLGVEESVITVDSGAIFELNGSDLKTKAFVLAGGTVQTSANRTSVDDKRLDPGGAAIGKVTLTANSSLLTTIQGVNFFVYGDVDLGGFELTESQLLGGTYFGINEDGKCFTNGTVNVTGGGNFRVTKETHNETADFILCCALRLDGNTWVRDLTVTYASVYGTSTKDFNICGTYTPTSNYIYNFVMQNGSTLNLRDKKNVWVSEFTLTGNVFKALRFADNATIKVIPPEASPFNQERKIVSWSEAGKPTNLDTLTFEVAPGYDGFVVKKDDGLYYHRGMTLILR